MLAINAIHLQNEASQGITRSIGCLTKKKKERKTPLISAGGEREGCGRTCPAQSIPPVQETLHIPTLPLDVNRENCSMEIEPAVQGRAEAQHHRGQLDGAG